MTGEDREAATISGINGVFTEGVKAEWLPGAYSPDAGVRDGEECATHGPAPGC